MYLFSVKDMYLNTGISHFSLTMLPEVLSSPFGNNVFSSDLMISFSLVLACTACPLFCVKWMRSTPYLLGADVMHWINKMDVFNTSCCWVLFSGCPSRSRRLLSGRRHSRWWCSAHHCWTRVNFRLNHDQESQSLPVVNISYLLGVVLVELRHPHTGSWSEHLNNNKKTNVLQHKSDQISPVDSVQREKS